MRDFCGQGRVVVRVCLVSVLVLGGLLPALARPALARDYTAAELKLGEAMYRQGVLPSGAPIKAFVSGDVPVEGTAFTCVSCHLRSGLGSVEGAVVTPPAAGRFLYQERKPFLKNAPFVPYYSAYAKYLPVRPAYTDDTLAKLIASGVDPTGRSVLKVMPRYEIDDADMAILVAYLKTLSAAPSPGVEKNLIKFATVIVDGTDPRKVASMLVPIEFSVERKNSLTTASKANDRVARLGYNSMGDLAFIDFTLDKWVLKGEPDTWRAQLEEYYRKNQVFALLGGISDAEWEPVHAFCQDHGIPDLFPVVDYPDLSDPNWYTQYLSRGVRQEGEAAAHYLNTLAELFQGRPVVQLARDDRRGQALAAGFRDTWKQTGHDPVVDIPLPGTQPLTRDLVEKVVSERHPAALLVWDDKEGVLDALATLADNKERPGTVLLSGTTLKEQVWPVPKPLRQWVFLTWPYRLPQDEKRYDVNLNRVLQGQSPASFDPVVLRKSYVTQQVLGTALKMMRGEYLRDFLLDTIGMLEDQYVPLYERLSFGPDQRFASKGCFIVQFGQGDHPTLERRSEWVIQ